MELSLVSLSMRMASRSGPGALSEGVAPLREREKEEGEEIEKRERDESERERRQRRERF